MKSNKPTLGATCALLALLLAPSVASADVIVDYKMTAFGAPLNDPATAAPTTTAANVTATTLVNQSGGTFSGTNNYNGGSDRVTNWSVAVSSTAPTFADAISRGNFITFNLTVAPGFQINLTSITFQVAAATTATTSDRAFYLATETATTSFTASSTVFATDRTNPSPPISGGPTPGTIPYQNGTVNNTVPQNYSVDLTSLGAISSTQTQYFRFYLQAAIGQSLSFDDIVVNGTVTAVPEPSTYAALAGASALVLVSLRRRRR